MGALIGFFSMIFFFEKGRYYQNVNKGTFFMCCKYSIFNREHLYII